MSGILGKKIGMIQIFEASGEQVGVTAIQAGPCPVLAVHKKNIQLGFDQVDEKKLKKPQAAYFKKLNISACKLIRELAKPAQECKPGDQVKVDIFGVGDFVDISGTSIGKGFQGGMKRWHWKGGPMTHGSTSHRRIGSIGSTTTPGRVWKGHHLPGHMGNEKVTIQNLKVIRADAGKNILLVKGAVPGPKNGYLIITQAKKKTIKIMAARKAAKK